MSDGAGGRRLHAFRSLTGRAALLRVLATYVLYILVEYAVWIAKLVLACTRGGAISAGLVAAARLVPAAGGGAHRRPPLPRCTWPPVLS